MRHLHPGMAGFEDRRERQPVNDHPGSVPNVQSRSAHDPCLTKVFGPYQNRVTLGSLASYHQGPVKRICPIGKVDNRASASLLHGGFQLCNRADQDGARLHRLAMGDSRSKQQASHEAAFQHFHLSS